MSFTQAQLDALDKAIAEGVLTVRYADKQVTYRSLEEMMRLRRIITNELGRTKSVIEIKPEFSKGLV